MYIAKKEEVNSKGKILGNVKCACYQNNLNILLITDKEYNMGLIHLNSYDHVYLTSRPSKRLYIVVRYELDCDIVEKEYYTDVCGFHMRGNVKEELNFISGGAMYSIRKIVTLKIVEVKQ